MTTHGRLAYCLVAALAAFTTACSGTTCIAPDVSCSGTCVNPNTDSSNCGVCGKTCASGQACVSGGCKTTCPTGSTLCGTTCTSLQTDNANCGTCGTACPSGQVCSAGTCSVGCATGTTLCTADGGSTCQNLQNNPSDCGTCGKACGSGQLCSKGVCGVSCVSGELDCGGLCIDPKTDPSDCGGCAGDGGVACPTGQLCNGAGACSASCLGGETLCSGLCTSTNTDPLNCGGCGTVCPSGEICNGSGTCSASCLTGEDLCNGLCTNPNTDPFNCGGCAGDGGVACASGEICNGSGTCAATCLTGETLCNGLCTNTNTDPFNCGGCAGVAGGGVACPSGEICNGSGTCAATCLTGESLCGTLCTNTNTDPLNCGGCAGDGGVACPSGELCNGTGACAATCLTGEQLCAGLCTDTKTDPLNCGGCAGAGGVACPSGELCNGSGQCSATCLTGEALCKGLCTNTKTDPNNCGGCAGDGGVACPSGQLCNGSGACATTCLASETLCNGLCTSTITDRLNCGTCGNACAAGQVCSAGACSVSCTTGYTTCGTGASAYCANLKSDGNNCGTCGDACPSGEICNGAGACGPSCLAGELLCNGVCTNPQTDTLNCGACFNACDVGAICGSGVCACPNNPGGVTGLELDCDGTNATGCPGNNCGGSYACSDTLNDVKNCSPSGSGCGTACPTGEICNGSGVCAVSCIAAENTCTVGGAPVCVDEQTDPTHCGSCNIACDTGATCTSGTCGCPSGLDCAANVSAPSATGHSGAGYACVSPLNDVNNCSPAGSGVCGTACPTGEICNGSGVCAVSCIGTENQCTVGGALVCVDEQTDPTHCGSCNIACDTGATCTSGTCGCPSGLDCAANVSAPSATGHSGAGYACVSPLNDVNNCSPAGSGVCGTACPTGEICNGSGVCAVSCIGTENQCTVGGALVCVDEQTDPTHCGSCNIACDTGATCTSGTCGCPSGLDCAANVSAPSATGHSGAGYACVSPLNDVNNCSPAGSGVCGTACPTGEICNGSGVCAVSCIASENQCTVGGALVCVDEQTDPTHCGSCSTVCDTGATCTSGTCGCPSGLDCAANVTTPSATGHSGAGYACVSPLNDVNNCSPAGSGVCGTACPTGEICNGSGVCAVSCIGTENQCTVGGALVCVDEQTDPTHCGSCNIACDTGATCTSGTCGCPSGLDCAANVSAPSATGHSGAGYACVSPLNDVNNCSPAGSGVCGTACPTGEICNGSGVCAVSCIGTENQCTVGGALVCVDEQTDPTHCGSCNIACDTGATCTSGTCGCPSGLDCAANVTTPSATGHSGAGYACVSPLSDVNNCSPAGSGVCGTACPTGEICNGSGVCALSCIGTENQCTVGGALVCVDEQTDPTHCGSCNIACDTGATCTSGTCGCPSGLDCAANVSAPSATGHSGAGYACVSPLSDVNNCSPAGSGVCGTACPTGEICNGSGVCALSCIGTENQCTVGGALVCVDEQTDPTHCGSCNIACDTGATCTSGTCGCPSGLDCAANVSAPSATGHSGAGYACVSPLSDVNNCSPAGSGVCGTACPTGEICNGSGVCAVSCIGTETFCSATQSGNGVAGCYDTLNSPNNCSSTNACGTKCDTGATCTGGTCGCPAGSGELDCATNVNAASVNGHSGAAYACVNPANDPNNCSPAGSGFCGTACLGATPYCLSGACEGGCGPGGGTLCGGACVNTQTDGSNCGSCGNNCVTNLGAGAICSGGVCSLPPLTVTPSGDTNETINPSTPQSVPSGTTQAFTVTPSTDYVVSTTVGGTCPAGSWSGSAYTTGKITADCTVIFSASCDTAAGFVAGPSCISCVQAYTQIATNTDCDGQGQPTEISPVASVDACYQLCLGMAGCNFFDYYPLSGPLCNLTPSCFPADRQGSEAQGTLYQIVLPGCGTCGSCGSNNGTSESCSGSGSCICPTSNGAPSAVAAGGACSTNCDCATSPGPGPFLSGSESGTCSPGGSCCATRGDKNFDNATGCACTPGDDNFEGGLGSDCSSAFCNVNTDTCCSGATSPGSDNGQGASGCACAGNADCNSGTCLGTKYCM